MDLSNKRVLVVSPESWGAIRLSKHHFTKALADLGAHVFFLEPNGTAKALTSRKSEHKNITILSQGTQTKGLRFLPAIVQRRIEKKYFDSVEEHCTTKFDLLWNFDAFQFRYLHKSDRPNCKHIFHLLDFPKGGNVQHQAQHCDLAIAVRPDIFELLKNSGVASPLLQRHAYAPRTVQELHDSRLIQSQIKLGCVGNMAIKYLDLEGLRRIAELHQDVQLVLIGPRNSSNLSNEDTSTNDFPWNKLIELPNVTWVGPINFMEIPTWLNAMDGLLIAYNSKLYRNEISSPHKLLEYLASGKEILSSFLSGLPEEEKSLIQMLDAGVSVVDGIDELKKQIAAQNASKRADRMAFADKHTYDKTTAHILSQIFT